MVNYARSPQQLIEKAVLFWPKELVERESSSSVIPLLIETQDKFISLLNISDADPEAWQVTLQATKGLPANLFLKHLMVLADISGERLKRLRFNEVFPASSMKYSWRGQVYEYQFKVITACNSISNSSLAVDGKKLAAPHPLNNAMKDTAMLILYGAASTGARIPDEVMEKCVIGSLIGHHDELMKFVKERYIWVSRITGGATANAMGQLAQNYVLEICSQFLPDWTFRRDSTIPGITHNEGATETNFDIVATSPGGKHTAIEVCFQVTTNSVIERKGGQAQARFQLLQAAGHRIAYVVDGAGNFERRAALSNICRYSDCTVALSLGELELLTQFLQDSGKDQ